MVRLIAGSIWIIAVTSASAYIAANWRPAGVENKERLQNPGDIQRKKTAPINVPMIANGKIAGYIVAQFVFLADARDLEKLAVPPDDFITDEVFRQLYCAKVDFDNLEKYDLQGLTNILIEKTNQRLGGNIIKDILVVEFTYIPKREISK